MLDDLKQKGIAIRVASPKLVQEEVISHSHHSFSSILIFFRHLILIKMSPMLLKHVMQRELVNYV